MIGKKLEYLKSLAWHGIQDLEIKIFVFSSSCPIRMQQLVERGGLL